MADRRHQSHNFPQNFAHNSFQQSHIPPPHIPPPHIPPPHIPPPRIPPPPLRSQQHNPQAHQAPSEFGHHHVYSGRRDTPVRDTYSHEKWDGDFAESHNHQIQGSVRGPVHSQHGRGRPVVQQNQQYARPNVQGTHHPASYNAQVNHPQSEFPTRAPSEHMNARQQMNPRVFNTNTAIHEADMNNQVVSRRKMPGQEDTTRFRQPGHGVQHAPNQFASTSLQPSHDQPRAFPLPGAPPVGRSTIPGNQPMGGPPARRMMPTEFQENSYLRNRTSQSDDSTSMGFQPKTYTSSQEKSYLRNGTSQSDDPTSMGFRPKTYTSPQEKSYLRNGTSKSDDSTSMGFQPKTYTSSTASDPSVQHRITQRRAETDHTEAYYGNPSPSNIPDSLQQQFERLRIPDTQGVGLSTRTYQPATAVISNGGIVREDAQKAHGHDSDRIHNGFSYDKDLFRNLTREGDYPVAGGGYADVYKGTLSGKQTAIKVAIKVIKMYSNDNDIKKKLQRLQREIEVWKKLDHDSVLKLLGTTSGYSQLPAMVCPWLENGTLTSYLERCAEKLEMSRILMLIYEVASGLQYLHSQSVVHGDLSGSNVLVDAKGQAFIADFGLSTILHESGVSAFVAPSTGKLRVTLRWVAPELLDLQEVGNAKSYTKPSDIYSFGGIMLQILSGKTPYHYYPRDAQVVKAISKGETTKRPNDPRVTNRRWMFIQRCWSPISVVYKRPSSDEIVTFSKDDLVGKDIQAGATGVVHGSRYPTP